MTICTGCNSDYAGKAYKLHVQNNRNPACRAIFEKASAAGLASTVPEPEDQHAQFGDADNHRFPRGSTAFEGDFFGDAADYDLEDFGYRDSDDEDGGPQAGHGDADEEEDFSAQEAAELAAGYEPERPPVDPHADISMPNPEPSSLHKTAAPSWEVRKAAEDRFHHTPIIERYPSPLAGKPIKSNRGKTAEEQYESSLLGSTSDNPYAPFNSKMDWEIAKWAKLRGSGSTAFTDLLNVEGVGMFCT
ncbi:hypothetical protein B0H10DRAFT_1969189 [Mycena sp. CBHHK59/15]|nr:hypothetical protein B0H10DRAFT_1969189 [Mycena sp. CBHHK59/15]